MPDREWMPVRVPAQLHRLLTEVQDEEAARTGSKPTYAQIIWRWAQAAGAVKAA